MTCAVRSETITKALAWKHLYIARDSRVYERVPT